MPGKSGISHTFAAFLALVLAPLLEDLISVFVTADDVTAAIESTSAVLARYPQNPFGADTSTTVVYVGSIAVIAFVWGYAYHLSRHR